MEISQVIGTKIYNESLKDLYIGLYQTDDGKIIGYILENYIEYLTQCLYCGEEHLLKYHKIIGDVGKKDATRIGFCPNTKKEIKMHERKPNENISSNTNSGVQAIQDSVS